jgi:RNA polymerase sigma factor (sigma-70 family)
VFLTAWRRIDDVPDGEPGLHWLYGVAHRVLAHHWRSLGRKARLDRRLTALGAEQQDLVDHVLVVREEVRQVMQAASRLAPGELEVLTLAVWEGLTQATIASVLGISEGAVKQRTHRARKALLREVEKLEAKRARAVAREGGGSSWYQKTV